MASVVPLWLATGFLLPLLILLGLYIHFRLSTSKYWSSRGVPHLKPIFLLGNLWKANITENLSYSLSKIHLENRRRKVVGYWMFNKPQMMVMDADIIKRILIKDFNLFRDRGFDIDEKANPLGAHLFVLNGKRWRNLRVKLTPTFTSGKMKLMFPAMSKCGDELVKQLRKSADSKAPVEVKDLLARFTTDVISNVAFGLETNSLENPDSEFRMHGKKFFEPNFRASVIRSMMFFFPKIAKLLSVQFLSKESRDFFINAVRDTVEYRERNNVTRNDFLQLLIQLIRNGRVEDADKNTINVDGMDDDAVVQKFSLTQAAAQCFVFFIAGFETSSTALTFALYELALNPDIQRRLQEEIDETAKKAEMSYDVLFSMEYLDMVVQETLRKYPPLGSLQRISSADYEMPDLGVTLEKGTTIMVSVTGLHHDPDTYPDPERFDPERFTEEAKSQRDSMAFLPFGDGPRSCIGNRFALMQIKIGLIWILKEFTVDVTENTPIPVKFEINTFVRTAVGGVPLMFTRRN